MAKGSVINKVLKGIGKGANNAEHIASKTFDRGVSVANSFNKKFFRDITEEELKDNYSILQHITKRKAKTSTNLLAFSGLALYGTAEGFDRESKAVGMGEVEAGQMYDTTDSFVSPTLEKELDMQSKYPEYYEKQVMEASKEYGSAGPDLVFALHQLRNR